MIPPDERRPKVREAAALFQAHLFRAQLSAFGEVLATHPYASDRPDAAHETVAGYVRALDAYEAAKREASRDSALARRELDTAVAALNRLNAHIAGTVLPETPTSGPHAHTQERQQRAHPTKKAASAASPEQSGPAGPVGLSKKARPSPPARPRATEGRSKPRFRDRHTKGALAGYAGLAVWAIYSLAVLVVGGWLAPRVTFGCLLWGLALAGVGGSFIWEMRGELRSVRSGKPVVAEYSHTAKSKSSDSSWEQCYEYVDAAGEKVTYRRGVSKESLAALPTRRLWLSKGEKTELKSLGWVMLGLPLGLIFCMLLFLTGAALILAAVPGVLLFGLTGHHFD